MNLAILNIDKGNYEQALGYSLEARYIFEDRLNDREHPFYLRCLMNLAVLYGHLGNYEEAERLHLESLKNFGRYGWQGTSSLC